jgi:hypothetical protein
MFGALGPSMKYFIRPFDSLYEFKDENIEDLTTKKGLNNTSKNDFISDDTLKLRKVMYDLNGAFQSDTAYNNQVLKDTANLSRLSLVIDKDISLKKILNIGAAVKFDTKAVQHVDLTGMYIMSGTEIMLNKGHAWSGSANIVLIRTNKVL